MDTLDALRDLDVPAVTTLVVAIMIATFVAVDPILGRRQHAELVAGLAAAPDGETRDSLLCSFYRSWTWQGWLAGAAAVAAALLLPGIGLADLGLRLPDLAFLAPDDREHLTSTAIGAVVGFALAAGALVLVQRRWPASPRPQNAAVDAMLPTTPAARRGWAGLSLSAGVTEELTYRGLLVLALSLAVPDLPHGAVVAVAAVLFGLAHWYQGWLGVLTTGVVGAAFTQLYLSTGSLLLPMVLHVLVDLRLLLVRPAPAPAATGV